MLYKALPIDVSKLLVPYAASITLQRAYCLLSTLPTLYVHYLSTICPKMGPSVISAAFAALSLTFVVWAQPDAGSEDHLARDFATLQAFAETITVDEAGIKQNWTTDDVCSFNGSICDMVPAGYKAVVGFDINEYHLGDNLQLTGLLDELTDLQFFHVNSNGFVGTVPDISNLRNLSELDLSVNMLSGLFPASALSLPLIFLDLRFNAFEGPLPPNTFSVPTLQALYLNNNNFSGPLPEADVTDLFSVTLASNQLTGPIPASLANWISLEEIYMGENQLTGTIPEELCGLVNMSYIDVSFNVGMSGTLGPKCSSLLQTDSLNITGTALKAVSS